MSICQFIQRLLNIKAFSVKDVSFRNYFKELWVEVKPYKNGALCPHCKRRGKILRVVDTPRVWRDIPVCGRQVFFFYSPREIICRTHGRVQEDIPWAAPHARVTHRFEYSLLIYCTTMTQKAAAQLLKVSTSTLSDHLHRSLAEQGKTTRLRGSDRSGSTKFPIARGINMPPLFMTWRGHALSGSAKAKRKRPLIAFVGLILLMKKRRPG